MPASIVGAGIGLWSSHEQREAQRKASRDSERAARQRQQEMLKEQRKARQEADARTPKQAQERDNSNDPSYDARLRGVQATMLASRKAQNSGGGGKSLLGE